MGLVLPEKEKCRTKAIAGHWTVRQSEYRFSAGSAAYGNCPWAWPALGVKAGKHLLSESDSSREMTSLGRSRSLCLWCLWRCSLCSLCSLCFLCLWCLWRDDESSVRSRVTSSSSVVRRWRSGERDRCRFFLSFLCFFPDDEEPIFFIFSNKIEKISQFFYKRRRCDHKWEAGIYQPWIKKY